jgi:hypothetical protein
MEIESNRDARLIAEPFADGLYDFCLNNGAIKMLQEARDTGPLVLFALFERGMWKVEDIREVIRCGLIGGGMAPAQALKLVITYVDGRPPMENVALAQKVLGAGLVGAVDEPVGEHPAANLKGEVSESMTSPTAN